MPVDARKHQEAIFELIATEQAYLQALQHLATDFSAALTPVLSDKAFSVIFSNVDDLLIFNVRALGDRCC